MSDSSFEDRIRAELHSAVHGIDAAPLPSPVRNRARLRQSVAIAAVVVGLFAVTGTSVTLLTGNDGTTNEVATPGPTTDPRTSGEPGPCSNPDLEGQCVAHGEYDGIRWWLGARMKGDDLCIDEVQADSQGFLGGGGGCGPHDPDKIGHGFSFGADVPYGMANGEVRGAVDKLVLEREDGDPMPLELFPAPKDFPLDVKFFNVFLPPDPAALVAYDADGNEVIRQEISFAPGFMGDLAPEPQRKVIAGGNIDGEPWNMYVYDKHINDALAPCADITLGLNEVLGASGSCWDGVPQRRVVGFSEASFDPRPGWLAVFGSVDSRATRVVVEFDSGESHEADIHEHPGAGRNDVTFFVAWVEDFDPTVGGDLVVFDQNGDELARPRLCDDVAVGSLCGN